MDLLIAPEGIEMKIVPPFFAVPILLIAPEGIEINYFPPLIL